MHSDSIFQHSLIVFFFFFFKVHKLFLLLLLKIAKINTNFNVWNGGLLFFESVCNAFVRQIHGSASISPGYVSCQNLGRLWPCCNTVLTFFFNLICTNIYVYPCLKTCSRHATTVCAFTNKWSSFPFFPDGHKNKENICGWLVSKHSSGRREAVFWTIREGKNASFIKLKFLTECCHHISDQ